MPQATKVHKTTGSHVRRNNLHRSEHAHKIHHYDPIRGDSSANDCLVVFLVGGLAFLSFTGGVVQALLA